MIYLTLLIYVHPGKEAVFHEFEDLTIPLMARYGGEIVLRVRPGADSVISHRDEVPYEIHIGRFPTEDALAAFLRDEDRQRFLHLKNESVRTQLLLKGAAV